MSKNNKELKVYNECYFLEGNSLTSEKLYFSYRNFLFFLIFLSMNSSGSITSKNCQNS